MRKAAVAKTNIQDIIAPEGCAIIPLTKDKYAIIDSADFDLVNQFSWNANQKDSGWYASAGINRKTTGMHNLILNAKMVDHINHNGLDNRRVNLRPCTCGQNMANIRSHKDSKSKYKGVSAIKGDKWASKVTKEGKTYVLGVFYNEEDAAKAYDEKAKELFGEFAYLNFN